MMMLNNAQWPQERDSKHPEPSVAHAVRDVDILSMSDDDKFARVFLVTKFCCSKNTALRVGSNFRHFVDCVTFYKMRVYLSHFPH